MSKKIKKIIYAILVLLIRDFATLPMLQFKEMEVNAHRVFQLTDDTTYLHDKFGNVELPVFHGNIEFKRGSYSW